MAKTKKKQDEPKHKKITRRQVAHVRSEGTLGSAHARITEFVYVKGKTYVNLVLDGHPVTREVVR